MLCAYVFATGFTTRLSRAWRARGALLPCALRTAPRRRGFSIAVGSALGVRVPSKNERFTQPPNFQLQIKLVILSVPTNSPQLEQYNRVRGNSAKHATDGPKSRKLHYGELVGRGHVSPPNPRIKSQIPKGGFGALWHAFLPYLSSCNERWGPRRAYRLVVRQINS